MVSGEFRAIRAMIDETATAPPVTLAEQRASLDDMLGALPVADGVEVEVVEAAGRRAEWHRPADATDHALLYLHGGGYRLGSIEAYRGLCSNLAVALGAPVLAFDYRLAPEHPFPAAVDDAVAGFGWLVAQGIDASRLAIAGDSAGGGLTVAALVALRDQGRAQPAAAAALSPWADLTMTAESYDRNADFDPYVDRGDARFAAGDYLGDTDPTDPWASPAHADLTGIAPLLVQMSSHEILADDAVALTQAVARARGEIVVELWPEMTHVWHVMAPMVPEAVEALERVAAFIRRRWD